MAQILPFRPCVHCERTFRPKRRWQQFCSVACRREAGKNTAEYICEYCGMVGETVDHVPPVSIRPTLVMWGLADRYPFVLVRACRECNSVIGDKALWTVEDRKMYVASRLQRRYKRYLEMPDWSTIELDQLATTLRKTIEHELVVRNVTRQRLKHAMDAEVVLRVIPTHSEEQRPIKTPCLVCDKMIRDNECCSDLCDAIAGIEVDYIIFSISETKTVLKSLSKQKRLEFRFRRHEARLTVLKLELANKHLRRRKQR